MKSGKCLSCGTQVPVMANDKVGMLVYCPECDAELEIIKLNPVKFDWPLEDIDIDDDEEYSYHSMYDDDDYDDYQDD